MPLGKWCIAERRLLPDNEASVITKPAIIRIIRLTDSPKPPFKHPSTYPSNLINFK